LARQPVFDHNNAGTPCASTSQAAPQDNSTTPGPSSNSPSDQKSGDSANERVYLAYGTQNPHSTLQEEMFNLLGANDELLATEAQLDRGDPTLYGATKYMRGATIPSPNAASMAAPDPMAAKIPDPTFHHQTSYDMWKELKDAQNDQVIEGYDWVVSAIMIPVIIGDLLVCAMIDTGSTVTIINAKVAKLLSHRGRGTHRPSDLVATSFGSPHGVQFDGQMGARLAIASGGGWVNFQIWNNMEFDCLIGDDVLRRSGIRIDYESRTVGTGNLYQRMLTRGEVLTMMFHTDNLFRESVGAVPPVRP
jgi:hypothetical protein